MAEIPDLNLRGRAFASGEELRDLGSEVRDNGVSHETRILLARLASYPPVVRLTVNLKTLLGLMASLPKYRTIHSVLKEGLLPEEQSALAELDIMGLSINAREIAHGLLNVHERWIVMKDLRRIYDRAGKANDQYLRPIAEEADESEQ
jgi:hypothetical protein